MLISKSIVRTWLGESANLSAFYLYSTTNAGLNSIPYCMHVQVSKYQRLWHPDQSMSLIVSSIVHGVNEQNIIVKNVCADDWTATNVFFNSVCCEFQ